MRASSVRIAVTLVVSALVASGAALAVSPTGDHETMTARCVKVIDGDTLVVECDKHRMTVDLAGVDAPELEQPWGKEVRSFVNKMVRGRELEIAVTEKSGDAATARVMVGGHDLSRLLAERGLAWATGEGELQDLSDRAKDSPCGLWIEPDPVPPWEFRDASA